MSATKVIRVAVLVNADLRPKILSRLLDLTFADVDEVLQYAVEGHGWPEQGEPTEAWLMEALVGYAAERLLEPDNQEEER